MKRRTAKLLIWTGTCAVVVAVALFWFALLADVVLIEKAILGHPVVELLLIVATFGLVMALCSALVFMALDIIGMYGEDGDDER